VAQRWQLRFPAAALAALAALGPAGCLNAGCAACGAGGDSAASGGGSYRPVSPHCLAVMQRWRLPLSGNALAALGAVGHPAALRAACVAGVIQLQSVAAATALLRRIVWR
jgi:hypothetical protein